MINVDLTFLPPELLQKTSVYVKQAQTHLTALKEKRCVGKEWTGWYDYPRLKGLQLAAEVEQYVKGLECDYDLVVVIGIGGSYLGTRAVADAFSHDFFATKTKKIVYAGHHLSEAGLSDLLDLLDRHQPIVNVISKSGTTTEPAVALRIIRSYMQKRFSTEELKHRIVATTDPRKGALRELALEEGFKLFEVPEDIGGRYSVLSAVGLVPLALAGFDIKQLLSGANKYFATLNKIGGDAEVLKYAGARQACYENGKSTELLSYSEPRLRCLAEWWKQLFGESEGKQGKGLFPASLIYTTDLHSLGQYVQDGKRNLLETFLVFESYSHKLQVPRLAKDNDGLGYLEGKSIEEINAAAVQATKLAHFDGGVPCLEIRCGKLDIEHLGALFAFFETACALGGALLGVNPFDQPGVEAYKANLFALMDKPGFEELKKHLEERF